MPLNMLLNVSQINKADLLYKGELGRVKDSKTLFKVPKL
jgi:hypothetical protein